MNSNIEKLLSMLSMELIKIRESGDIAAMHTVKLEIDRLIKTDYKKLEEAMQEGYIEALNGQDEAEINGWLVSYKSGSRFALDMTKVTEFCGGKDALKENFYSHAITKPSLKFTNITK